MIIKFRAIVHWLLHPSHSVIVVCSWDGSTIERAKCENCKFEMCAHG